MTNKKIADSIANGLRSGTLVHPGRDGGEATPVVLPMFRTAGMAPEVAKLVEGTAELIAEAIVAHIEEEHDIVEKGFTPPPDDDPDSVRVVTVHCHCDAARTKPLAALTVTPSPHVVVDGKALIKGLSDRSAECPHERNS